ncbi:hypothetical protein DL765_007887 [Monosporascus sp. GIB2]|nr:hypothetical protein DL765_007887 [Monosporascus sp. GIB2]
MDAGLECHGFGEKPAWMDGGARQKAQAAKMKQRVAQVTRNRRMSQIRDQHESSMKRLQNTRTTGSKPNTSIANASSIPAKSHEPLLLNPAFNDSFQPQAEKSPYHQDDLNVTIDPAAFDEIAFLSDHNFDLPEIDSLSADDVRLTHNAATLGVPDCLHVGYSMPKSQVDMDYSPCATSMLPIANVEDAILLAHYMDKVFHWQFRFCSSTVSGFNQGYFIWLMSKSRPLYLASLALSSSYRSLQKTVEGSHPSLLSEEHMERYDIATEELQRNLKTHKPTDDVSTLACIVSFIFSSYLHSGKIDWNVHLKAGTSLIVPWIAQQQTEANSELHKSPEESSRVFFIGSIIRFDILSAITRDTAPTLSGSYRRLLAPTSPAILLETVSGCQNWVFDILLDVYLLRDWKRSTRAAGLLSLWELTSKANTIKTDLERRITSNLILMNKSKQELELRKDEHSKSRQCTYDICVVTHTFACAVSVLLEVIVSGAYPQLPEIKQKVGRALESFTYIDDPDLLEVLGWPLFVVGCVVEEEQHEFFRQLLSSSHVVRSVSLCGLLELLEKCWKSRESSEVRGDSFDFSHFQTYKSRDVLIA